MHSQRDARGQWPAQGMCDGKVDSTCRMVARPEWPPAGGGVLDAGPAASEEETMQGDIATCPFHHQRYRAISPSWEHVPFAVVVSLSSYQTHWRDVGGSTGTPVNLVVVGGGGGDAITRCAHSSSHGGLLS
ncbi:hypothetical protein CPLU01_01294 [Colletotrichum plurivorum]|uniref:Uncharacterized protein n=1 Tax=Colletotrichum plurivorum TaxID=2175906 RepID=A0A8H6U519_9PEZI|nr:hypothetical protein CPLU01_01294 [Colletotrichum plurivorum]